MLTLDPVLEISDTATFTLWPVMAPPESGLLALSGGLARVAAGTAVAALARYNDAGPADDGPADDEPTGNAPTDGAPTGHGPTGNVPGTGPAAGVDGAGELIRRLVEAECILAQGGLRVHDADTNVTVPPGCCFGLESWREWLLLTRGETPWLGHAPETHVEHLGSVIRLRSAESTGPAAQSAGRTGRAVELPVAALPGLLAEAQEKLRGFLRQVGLWADAYAPSYADALVARLDEELEVSGPLGL